MDIISLNKKNKSWGLCNEQETITEMLKRFNSISKVTADGVEYWQARELMVVLGYNNGVVLKTSLVKQYSL